MLLGTKQLTAGSWSVASYRGLDVGAVVKFGGALAVFVAVLPVFILPQNDILKQAANALCGMHACMYMYAQIHMCMCLCVYFHVCQLACVAVNIVML